MSTVLIQDGVLTISEIQLKIVEGKSHGKASKEIAGELQLSARTIEGHLYRLMDLYDCKSFAHLVATFFRNELIK